jgi:hypothetical protein
MFPVEYFQSSVRPLTVVGFKIDSYGLQALWLLLYRNCGQFTKSVAGGVMVGPQDICAALGCTIANDAISMRRLKQKMFVAFIVVLQSRKGNN